MITLNLLYYIRRTKERITYLFIHLNLCISLALGLVAFIGGIEGATEHDVCSYSYISYHVTSKNDYYNCLGCLHNCSGVATIFIDICVLLDVV